jgi:hypothetical protein
MKEPTSPEGYKTWRESLTDLELPNTVEQMEPWLLCVYELRMCVADLRHALSESLMSIAFPGIRPRVDAAKLLNETGNLALKYQCYRP